MIRKTRSPSLPAAYLTFTFGRNEPLDEWDFELPGLRGRVVNGWRSGMTLFVDGRPLDHSERGVAVSGSQAALSGETTDMNGQRRSVEVFVKAIFTVKIKVVVDGHPLSEGYL